MKSLLLGVSALMIGISKAGFGGGTGALVAPLLSLRFPSRKVIGLMLPMLLLSDIFNSFLYWKQWSVYHWLLLTPASACGIYLGSGVLRRMSDATLRKTIGLIAVTFSLIQLWRGTHIVPDWVGGAPFGALMGLLAGALSVIAHVGGIVTSMYLVMQPLTPTQFVATATAVYLFQNLLKIGPYLSQGILTREEALVNVRLLPFLIAGSLIGVYLNRTVDPHTFTRLVLILMMGTGIYLLLRNGREEPAVSDRMESISSEATPVNVVRVNP